MYKLLYRKERPGKHYIYVIITRTYLFGAMDIWIFENVENKTVSERHGKNIYIFKFQTKIDAMAFKLRWA